MMPPKKLAFDFAKGLIQMAQQVGFGIWLARESHATRRKRRSEKVI
jgi:hypothetical protein